MLSSMGKKPWVGRREEGDRTGGGWRVRLQVIHVSWCPALASSRQVEVNAHRRRMKVWLVWKGWPSNPSK